MSASETAIANLALVRLGESTILDIADPGNEFARVMNAAYAPQRDLLLMSFRWAFAMKRANLPALVDAPAWGYSQQFQLPADCLALDQVGDFYVGLSLTDQRGTDEADWAREGNVIMTDLGAPLPIRYIARVTEPGLFAPHFDELLSIRMAFVCCKKVTGSESAKEGLREDAKEVGRSALRALAIERPPQPIPDDSWIAAR